MRGVTTGLAGRPRQIVRNKVLSGAVKVMLIMLVYMCCTHVVCIWQVLQLFLFAQS